MGELPDSWLYGDSGSNTLGNVAAQVDLRLPHMASLGLGNILPPRGIPPASLLLAAHGKMAPRFPGKDTTIGHWELAGLVVEKPFPVYPQGFPPEIIEAFEKAIGKKVLGNKPASGIRIIEELGPLHLETGCPIVYTSADSVFQIAAHEEVIAVEELYRYCRIAREILQGEHGVARVIARPFVGEPGRFRRTERRRDFSLPPPGPTLLDLISSRGLEVMAVGKIKDIFAGKGVTRWVQARDNMEAVDRTLDFMREGRSGLIFSNLNDFDTLYGHRNDVAGFARALEEFDARLPEILAAMEPQDALILTADHGCDPTTPSTDHSREYVPLLFYSSKTKPCPLGTRRSFADVAAATIAQFLRIPYDLAGESFAPLLA